MTNTPQSSFLFTPSRSEETLRLTLKTGIDEVVKTDIEEIVQAGRLGEEMSFEELRPLFEKTLLLFHALSTANLDTISEATLQRLANLASKIKSEFDEFKTFSPNQFQNRPPRLQSYRERFQEVFDAIAPVLGVAQHVNLEQYEARAKNSVILLEEDRKQFQSQKANVEKELQETLRTAKDIAQQVGITQHEAIFRTESIEHKRAATGWLFITTALAVLTAIFAFMNYKKTLTLLEAASLPAGAIVQLAIAKLIIFSIMFSAVLWAGRVYRAHRHNYVINKHRQNALSTFEAFAKAATDTETKNAVLLQATQCIFSPQTTGYLGQDKETEGHSSSILEIIRSLPSAKT